MTRLAVTLISVAGTLGGAALSQRASRTEAAEQNRRADREQELARTEQALQEKRDLYAHAERAPRRPT